MGFLKTDQIAALLGFQARKVRDLCKSGELPAIEVGGEYRVDKRDFRGWLEKKRVKPPEKEEPEKGKLAQAQ